MPYKEWYSKAYIRWNLLQRIWNRELSYTAVRAKDGQSFHIKSETASSLANLTYHLTNDRHTAHDVYASLATYDLNDFKVLKDRTDRMDYFNDIKPQSYDVAFDIDRKNDIASAAVDALEIAKRLHDDGYRPEVTFSGNKGFHIITEEPFPVTGKKVEAGLDAWRTYCLSFAKDIDIDVAIYSPRREWRTPYSIHGKSGLVVLPLTLHQLAQFAENPKEAVEAMTPARVYAHTSLFNRGYIELFESEKPKSKEVQKHGI